MREYHKTMDARMFDFAAFYSTIAEKLPNNATIAEVGVATGTSAIFLAETLLNIGKSFKLLMVDNLAYGGGNQLQEILNHVISAQIPNVAIIPFDSLVACTRYPDEHFDFVFLDSSHQIEPTKAEIREWYQKVKEGGILAGHDYTGNSQVKMAVDIVVPTMVVRDPIPNRQFQPEPVLMIEPTEQGHGVWWLQKKFYVRLN